MMYTELYQYLLQYRQLPVPGIGTFLLERKPAAIDFPAKRVAPPTYTIALQAANNRIPGNFFPWLGEVLNIDASDAAVRFTDFAVSLKKNIADGNVINWNGMGILSKGTGDQVKFTTSFTEFDTEDPVAAEKVIRQKAEHMVRVGEDEKTSAEMVEMLNQPVIKRSYWWAYALAIALLAIMFIGWYFSKHGVTISSAANGKKSAPQEAVPTYKTLQ